MPKFILLARLNRFISIVVLFCMTLHCAGRLGVLSWIYEQRQVIAFELGLTNKTPIAECGTAYLNDGLVIVQQDDSSQGRPSVTFQAKEICLFVEESSFEIFSVKVLINRQYPPDLMSQIPFGYDKGIFHPPSLA